MSARLVERANDRGELLPRFHRRAREVVRQRRDDPAVVVADAEVPPEPLGNGLSQGVADGLPAARRRAKNAGLLLAYEKTGYDKTGPARLPDLLDNWSAQRLKGAGADCVNRVRSILLGVVEPTRREAGCISYALLQNRTDPADFTFVEEWASDVAIDAHLRSKHVMCALAELTGLLSAPPDIRRYNSVLSA